MRGDLLKFKLLLYGSSGEIQEGFALSCTPENPRFHLHASSYGVRLVTSEILQKDSLGEILRVTDQFPVGSEQLFEPLPLFESLIVE